MIVRFGVTRRQLRTENRGLRDALAHDRRVHARELMAGAERISRLTEQVFRLERDRASLELKLTVTKDQQADAAALEARMLDTDQSALNRELLTELQKQRELVTRITAAVDQHWREYTTTPYRGASINGRNLLHDLSSLLGVR